MAKSCSEDKKLVARLMAKTKSSGKACGEGKKLVARPCGEDKELVAKPCGKRT